MGATSPGLRRYSGRRRQTDRVRRSLRLPGGSRCQRHLQGARRAWPADREARLSRRGPKGRGTRFPQGKSGRGVHHVEGGGSLVEKPYEAFGREKVTVGGKEVIKPWTPHWVFHGSGVLHNERKGCIACPCDCPGGIMARFELAGSGCCWDQDADKA